MRIGQSETTDKTTLEKQIIDAVKAGNDVKPIADRYYAKLLGKYLSDNCLLILHKWNNLEFHSFIDELIRLCPSSEFVWAQTDYSVSVAIRCGSVSLLIKAMFSDDGNCNCELVYGNQFVAQPNFYDASSFADFINVVPKLFRRWEATWKRILHKAMVESKRQKLTDIALDTYIVTKLGNHKIPYYLKYTKNDIQVFFKIGWGKKFMVSVPAFDFVETIDNALAVVIPLFDAINAADAAGRHFDITYSEKWQNSIIE